MEAWGGKGLSELQNPHRGRLELEQEAYYRSVRAISHRPFDSLF